MESALIVTNSEKSIVFLTDMLRSISCDNIGAMLMVETFMGVGEITQ